MREKKEVKNAGFAAHAGSVAAQPYFIAFSSSIITSPVTAELWPGASRRPKAITATLAKASDTTEQEERDFILHTYIQDSHVIYVQGCRPDFKQTKKEMKECQRA